MANVRKIIIQGDSILREKSAEVRRFNESLHQLLDDMAITMEAANGVGLAAPQVGISKKAIVVRDEANNCTLEFVNPVLLSAKGMVEDIEGCLSVPDIQGMVPRSKKLTIAYQDRNGQAGEMKADGFLARIIQHEMDHLQGRLFIDIMTEEIKD
ncbi:MAG: peptide deformylase [Clostridiales bacterium]